MKIKIKKGKRSGYEVPVEAVRSATIPSGGDNPCTKSFMRTSDFSFGPRHDEPSLLRISWVSDVTRLKRTSSQAKST